MIRNLFVYTDRLIFNQSNEKKLEYNLSSDLVDKRLKYRVLVCFGEIFV